MSGAVVVDASLAVKWVLKEAYSVEALELLDEWAEQGVQAIAPSLLLFEAANAIYRRVGRGEMTLDAARHRVEDLLVLGPELDHERSSYARALELAQQFRRPTVYDAHYLALAEREGCECWTADERFWNAVRAKLPWVHWVGEYRG